MTSLSNHRAADAFEMAIGQQVIAFSLLVPAFVDWRHVLKICSAALIVFWSTVFFLWRRRPDGFTKRDLALIWWGYFPLLIIFWITARFYFVLTDPWI
jgi:hypothetical protein